MTNLFIRLSVTIFNSCSRRFFFFLINNCAAWSITLPSAEYFRRRKYFIQSRSAKKRVQKGQSAATICSKSSLEVERQKIGPAWEIPEMADNKNSSDKSGDISALIRGNHQTQYLLGREAVNG